MGHLVIRSCGRVPATVEVMEQREVAAQLAAVGIGLTQLGLPEVVFDRHALPDEIIGDYLDVLDNLTARFARPAIDVAGVLPEQDDAQLLARRYAQPHTHDVAESMLMVWGAGTLCVSCTADPCGNDPGSDVVLELACEPGDLVQIPPGIWHGFHSAAGIGFRALRISDVSAHAIR